MRGGGRHHQHHKAADNRTRRRRVLAVLGWIAGISFLILLTVGWGLLLLRLIHYGQGFDYGTTPPLRKWTPIQLFAMFCTVIFFVPIIAAAGIVQRLRKNRAFRAWTSRIWEVHSPQEEASSTLENGTRGRGPGE
jgi:hypothetical protein